MSGGDVIGSLDLATLGDGYAKGTLSVAAVVEAVLGRIAAAGDDHVWISRCDPADLRHRAGELDALTRDQAARLPLFGIPFAVKDNIDVAGMPTTAACPDFAYQPKATAPVLKRLLEAGAVLVGKTNLDQFATGLVGVRSPYGIPRNPFDPRYIPGGSSSGSAVAVSSGLVGFALGTDTAGSGRVPAAFNNIVGLKPTRGALSTSGVVPACRSLDCVSIFALTSADAAAVFDVARGFDPDDPYSRTVEDAALPERFRFGVPRAEDLRFFGDDAAAQLFADAVERLTELGGKSVAIDFTPFRETADLLYSGPWVAERMAAVETFLRDRPESVHAVTRRIIQSADAFSAVDAFRAMYRLEELRRTASRAWREIDVLLVPTAGTIYTVDQLEADPVVLNTNLGAYTNFTNLLDLSAVAVPNGFGPLGLPLGVTLIAPAGRDRALAALGSRWQRATGLTLGATGAPLPDRPAEAPPSEGTLVAVVGGHMEGMPLNGELVALGARKVAAVRTEPLYRLFALSGMTPARPGLLRVGPDEGHAIEAELWAVPDAGFARFVSGIGTPLGIGTVLIDGVGPVKGFLCEAFATHGAEDISHLGGWRPMSRNVPERG
ncbi:allophanate hydrolase [Skermanella pratensis]|uniref:allophanate hydrolase n=1 Tax=Skermanella pratensis TaxID=2233999 RepID=UPI00130179C0|nr:allophanate hydrolase [Skermanella pratensis]